MHRRICKYDRLGRSLPCSWFSSSRNLGEEFFLSLKCSHDGGSRQARKVVLIVQRNAVAIRIETLPQVRAGTQTHGENGKKNHVPRARGNA